MSIDAPTWHPGWSPPESRWDPFQLSSTHPTATLTIVEVVGGLDIATCPEFDLHLDHELHDPARGEVRDVIVDLTGLEVLSAAGVGSVLRADATARDEHVRLQLVITPGTATRTLTLLELDGRLCVHPDLTTARRATT